MPAATHRSFTLPPPPNYGPRHPVGGRGALFPASTSPPPTPVPWQVQVVLLELLDRSLATAPDKWRLHAAVLWGGGWWWLSTTLGPALVATVCPLGQCGVVGGLGDLTTFNHQVSPYSGRSYDAEGIFLANCHEGWGGKG